MSPTPPVLPARYIANTTPIDVCPCQWGPSGHCGAGRHEKCPRTVMPEWHGKPTCETHIVSRRDSAALTPVWRVGKPCRWLCPCRCHTEVQTLFPAPPRHPGRSSRTGGNGHLRIATTDRIRDDDAPALFELPDGGPA